MSAAWDPSRRVFLKGAGVAALGVGFAPTALFERTALAAGAGERVLVQLFLRGGADGLNQLVPHGDPDYYTLRPGIALRLANGVVNLDGFFGLHPSLAPMKELWDEGILAALPAVGNSGLTRSHFDAQDYMDTGTPGQKAYPTGWMDRVAADVPGSPLVQAVSIASQLPRALVGDEPALVVSSTTGFELQAGSNRARGWREEAEPLLRGLYASADDPVHRVGKDVFGAIDLLRSTPAVVAGPANGAVYPAGTAGTALRTAAQIIKADFGTRVIFIPLGGAFDTHRDQLPGNVADYDRLGPAIRAFRQDLGPSIDRVLLMVTTEFGRTATENGSRGTDHGWAHAEWFLGGGVRGGRVHSRWPGLAWEQLNERRDLAYTVDFRDSFSMAARWLGVRDTGALFPGHTPGPDPGVLGA